MCRFYHKSRHATSDSGTSYSLYPSDGNGTWTIILWTCLTFQISDRNQRKFRMSIHVWKAAVDPWRWCSTCCFPFCWSWPWKDQEKRQKAAMCEYERTSVETFSLSRPQKPFILHAVYLSFLVLCLLFHPTVFWFRDENKLCLSCKCPQTIQNLDLSQKHPQSYTRHKTQFCFKRAVILTDGPWFRKKWQVGWKELMWNGHFNTRRKNNQVKMSFLELGTASSQIVFVRAKSVPR